MRAGCHVLVEKPLAATLAQADALAALAAETGRVLQVGHLLRYSAEHRAIASRITRRFISRPRALRRSSHAAPMSRSSWI